MIKIVFPLSKRIKGSTLYLEQNSRKLPTSVSIDFDIFEPIK